MIPQENTESSLALSESPRLAKPLLDLTTMMIDLSQLTLFIIIPWEITKIISGHLI
jgi:hypothetical protein